MSAPAIYITRTGGTLHMPDSRTMTPLTDQHNAPGIVRGILENLDWPSRVVHVGPISGTPLECFNDCSFCPDMSVADRDDPETQWWIADEAAEFIKNATGQESNFIWIDVSGSAPSKAIVDWAFDDGITVQQHGARNVGPWLCLAHKLEAARISIVTDPRCMPHTHEMVRSPFLRPLAVLTQGQKRGLKKKINGRNFAFDCTYAGVENWFSYMMPDPFYVGEMNRGAGNDVYMGGCHTHKHKAWPRMASRRKTIQKLCDNLHFKVCTDDWYAEGFIEDETRRDPFMPPADLFERMRGRDYRHGLMLPPDDWFVTSKLRKYLYGGVYPLVSGLRDWVYDSGPFGGIAGILSDEAPYYFDESEYVINPRDPEVPITLDDKRSEVMFEVLDRLTRPSIETLQGLVEYLADKGRLETAKAYGGYREV